MQEIRELKDRIRELEAENKLWRDGENVELREVERLADRIAKAKEILHNAGPQSGDWPAGLLRTIDDALEALEGKE